MWLSPPPWLTPMWALGVFFVDNQNDHHSLMALIHLPQPAPEVLQVSSSQLPSPLYIGEATKVHKVEHFAEVTQQGDCLAGIQSRAAWLQGLLMSQ